MSNKLFCWMRSIADGFMPMLHYDSGRGFFFYWHFPELHLTTWMERINPETRKDLEAFLREWGCEKAIILPPILVINAGESISFLYFTLGSNEVYRCLMGDENIEFVREYPVENLIEKLSKRIFNYVYSR